MEKSVKKDHQINLRLTNDEFQKLRKKAADYKSMSSFILTACNNFDDRLGLKKLDALRDWGQEFNRWKYDIGKIGTNISQLTHYANECRQQGILNPSILELQNEQMRIWNEQLGKIIEFNNQITKLAKSVLK